MSRQFGGRDPFPSQAEIQGGTQLQKPSVLQQITASIAPQIPTVIHPKTSLTLKSSIVPQILTVIQPKTSLTLKSSIAPQILTVIQPKTSLTLKSSITPQTSTVLMQASSNVTTHPFLLFKRVMIPIVHIFSLFFLFGTITVGLEYFRVMEEF